MAAAGSVIGALRVELGLDTAQFAKGLKQSQSDLDRWGKTAVTAFKAIAASAVVGSLAAMAKASIDAADNMSKMAQKAGVSVEALSKLNYAASLSDVSLEQLVGGLNRLSMGMGNLATGAGGPLKTAFEALGIAATDATGNLRASDVVLAEIAGKFATMQDGATKTSLAMMIFGRAGAELIPLLNSGSAGLAEMAREAEQLGQVIGTDTAKQAELFNDNLTRLSAVGSGFVNLVVADILPALSDLSTWMTGLSANTNILKFAASGLAVVFKGLATMGVVLSNEISKVALTVGALTGAVQSLAGGKADEAMTKLLAGFIEIGVQGEETRKVLADLWDDTQDDLANVSSTDTPKETFFTPIIRDGRLAKQELDALKREAESLRDSLQDPFAEMTAGISRLQQMLDRGLISLQEFGDASLRLKSGTVAAFAGMASQVTGTLAGMFEDNKAIAVANAVVSGIEGVAKTLSAYPAPWSFAMAGVQAAAAALQVSNILSTSTSSKSMPNTVPSASVPSMSGGDMGVAGSVINLQLRGEHYGRAQVEDLMRQLVEAQGDGFTLVTT